MDPKISQNTHLSYCHVASQHVILCYNVNFPMFVPKCSDDGDKLSK
jgi:hypothetical protein